jgi:IS30 family transposase
MPRNRSISPYVRSRVFELIRKEQWSPEEVAGWLRKEENLSVSKSSIYNWISACPPHHKDNIRRHLRHGGRKAGSSPSSARIPIPNRISIDERQVNANGRTLGVMINSVTL